MKVHCECLNVTLHVEQARAYNAKEHYAAFGHAVHALKAHRPTAHAEFHVALLGVGGVKVVRKARWPRAQCAGDCHEHTRAHAVFYFVSAFLFFLFFFRLLLFSDSFRRARLRRAQRTDGAGAGGRCTANCC